MTTKTTYTIHLDASFDLHQGHGGDESAFDSWDAFVADFEATYRGAASVLGQRAGIEIVVDAPPLSQYGGISPTEAEASIWQAVHDVIFWDAEDGEWSYDPDGSAFARAVKAVRSLA